MQSNDQADGLFSGEVNSECTGQSKGQPNGQLNDQSSDLNAKWSYEPNYGCSHDGHQTSSCFHTKKHIYLSQKEKAWNVVIAGKWDLLDRAIVMSVIVYFTILV